VKAARTQYAHEDLALTIVQVHRGAEAAIIVGCQLSGGEMPVTFGDCCGWKIAIVDVW
jgi:hypothetical protein